MWMVCDVPPPQQCVERPFSLTTPPPSLIRPPASCVLNYIFTLPHADVCGVSLGTAFQPTTRNASVIINDLENVCNSDCGGNYAEHVKSTCKDDILKSRDTGGHLHTFRDWRHCWSILQICLWNSFIPRYTFHFMQCWTMYSRVQGWTYTDEISKLVAVIKRSTTTHSYFLTTTFNAGLITPAEFFAESHKNRT